MCESLDRMREEAKSAGKILGMAEGMQKGKMEGLAEGMQKGKIQGVTEGMKKGKEEGILTILKSLLNKELSDSYILEITGVSSELLLKAKQALN